MCTVTLVTGEDSYRLAMNRDERIARGPGLDAQLHNSLATSAIYPSDGAGGTWVAVNDHGIAFALLNWNDDAPRALNSGGSRSRGLVIPGLIASGSLAEARLQLRGFDWQGMLPFRLVGVFPSEREVWEWRGNSGGIESKVHRWETQHWYSSSISDEDARNFRGAACCAAWKQKDFGSLAWLRGLHASHQNGPGPFSICVHRDDVRTLSYTEVTSTQLEVSLSHFTGSPCSMKADSLQTSRLSKIYLPLPTATSID